MKYDFAVEKQFEKFIKNTTCGTVLTDARLQIIKKYFQYCYEAGHAQGYTDRIYDAENIVETEDGNIDIRTGEIIA